VTAPSPAVVGELFGERFGGRADGVWFAPGRANLMGEHTDYNEGFVLPFALGQGIVAAAARRADRRLVLNSAQEPGSLVEVFLDRLEPAEVPGWAAYPAGVAWALAATGCEVPGACIAFDSDLPAGAGLSSSAALECATALALTELAGTGPAGGGPAGTGLAGGGLAGAGLAGTAVGRRELATIARRAENDFVRVPSGIMDQSASLLGRRGHALLLDCRSLDSSQVPFDPAAARSSVLLINTRARHELAAGEYGRRRAECEQAARLLGVPSLRYVTDLGDLDRLTDPVLRRRARHVLTDNRRVLETVDWLTSPSGDAYPQIGRLLTESHRSLRDDFEISWPEADATVDAALAAGAFGARMIGGGFGGSVLALASSELAVQVRTAVAGAFARRSWTAPEFLEAAPSDGARRLV
jgi:galactokinase